MTLRRVYLYVVSAASLAVLALGLAGLGFTALYFPFHAPDAQFSRSTLGVYTAAILVAGAIWVVHFSFARRFAMRDPTERGSMVRNLYLYTAVAAGSVGGAIAIAIAAGDVFRPLVDTCTVYGQGAQFAFEETCNAQANWEATSQAAWIAVVLAAIWAFHTWVAERDREAVGESSAAATVRRWFMYASLTVGVLMLLAGLAAALEVAWDKYVQSPLGNFRYVGDGLGWAAGGFVLWAAHGLTISRRHLAPDRHSTLRALQGFVVVAFSIAAALTGVGSILYYLLGRALGAPNPGGIDPNDILGSFASPGARLVVYGVAWVLVTRRLTRDAGTQEADRQAAIRRLYTNLVCLVGLATWGAGAAILLGVWGEQLEARIIGDSPEWRDPTSFGLTFVIVGAAVWLAYWRPSPWAGDRQSFSRRAYLWAALLGSVLAALGGGVTALATVLSQLFSANPTLHDPANLAFAQGLSVVVVAAGIGAYHWRILRADARARPAKVEPEREAVEKLQLIQPAAVRPEPVLAIDPHSHRYTLVVIDATEDDIHQALATLPPQASYHLTPGANGQ